MYFEKKKFSKKKSFPPTYHTDFSGCNLNQHIFLFGHTRFKNAVKPLRMKQYYSNNNYNVDRVKRIWYLSPMWAAKVQASLRIRAASPEPSLLAHTNSESRGTFRQKARSLAPLNGWACAVKICHDGMLEDTNSLDGAHVNLLIWLLLHHM